MAMELKTLHKLPVMEWWRKPVMQWRRKGWD